MGLTESAKEYFDQKAVDYFNIHYKTKTINAMWNRHNAILSLVAKYSGESKFKILDIGCGPGLLALDLAEMGHNVTGLDTSQVMLKIAEEKAIQKGMQKKVKFVEGDAEYLELESNSYDAVIAAGVIEYMEKDERFMAEAGRIMKPGGYLIVNITNKLGYSGILVPYTNSLKQIRVFNILGNKIKKFFSSKNEQVSILPFKPRRHFPWQFRSSLEKAGFAFVEDIYLSFSLLPSPLSTLFKRITDPIDKKMHLLNKSPFRIFGDCYLVVARLVN